MQLSVIAILTAAVLFLMYDDSSKKVELAQAQASVVDLQTRLNNQQQAAQTAEMSKLQQEVQQLTQQRDRATQQIQQATAAERDRATNAAQQLAAQELARAKATPTATQPNWLQQRIDKNPTLDNPATPVGPSRRYWVDQYGVRHYYY